MGNPLHLFFSDLGRADIHAPVDLHGVRGDHTAAKSLANSTAAALFPEAVGPATMIIFGNEFSVIGLLCYLYDPLKLSLDLLFGQGDHGGAAVRTMVGIFQGQKFFDQCLCLRLRHGRIALDRCLAGHGSNLCKDGLRRPFHLGIHDLLQGLTEKLLGLLPYRSMGIARMA